MSTADPLRSLAEKLRSDDTVISAHVVDPLAEPVFGPLAATRPAHRDGAAGLRPCRGVDPRGL